MFIIIANVSVDLRVVWFGRLTCARSWFSGLGNLENFLGKSIGKHAKFSCFFFNKALSELYTRVLVEIFFKIHKFKSQKYLCLHDWLSTNFLNSFNFPGGPGYYFSPQYSRNFHQKINEKSSEKTTKKYLPKSLITDVYFNIFNKKKKINEIKAENHIKRILFSFPKYFQEKSEEELLANQSHRPSVTSREKCFFLSRVSLFLKDC